MDSIISTEKRCFLCGQQNGLTLHHCVHGANRKKADEDGLTVYLCVLCHTNLHQRGWHDKDLKVIAQKAWESHYGTTEDFIDRYGKSYL